nr:MAG TPA: hypothetical protein [Caudoviricetes sp.]
MCEIISHEEKVLPILTSCKFDIGLVAPKPLSFLHPFGPLTARAVILC